MMRINVTSLFIILTFLQVSATGFAQKITLSKENVSLREVFDEINVQTGYDYVWFAKNIKNTITIDVHVHNRPFEPALQQVLKGLPLTYEIEGKTIIIKEKEKTIIEKVKGFFSEEEDVLQQSISGRVSDTTGAPLPGVVVRVKGTSNGTFTDKDGRYELPNIDSNAVLVFSMLGFESQEIGIGDNTVINVILKIDVGKLDQVVVSTGYETIPKERATGSFVQIDNELLNRRVSTNILDRLDGVTSGMIFNTHNNRQYHQSDIQIRGRATLFANPDPLIILDNFPYEGDIRNINPGDIESITILKDAAAAAAWGARSGNGVIVITTKKGQLNREPVVNFNVSLNIGDKPDLYYQPQLSSGQYIDVEQFLFNKGAFNYYINNGYSTLSPAVEVFLKRRNGQISAADSMAMINTMKGVDSRDQILDYYYRSSLHHQYQVSINGGGSDQKYFLSAGYDKNLNSYVNNSYDRITLNASNTYYLLDRKLELYTNILFTSSKSVSGPVISNASYPYEQLADEDGNPLPLTNNLRLSYADTVGDGRLLDWHYYPLKQLRNDYSQSVNSMADYRLNLSAKYRIFPWLQAAIKYNYGKGLNESVTFHEPESFYTRNLINTYTQIDHLTGEVVRPVPFGGIRLSRLANRTVHNARFQVDYDYQWKQHSVNAIAGTEIRDFSQFSSSGGLYGYDINTATDQNAVVDHTADLPVYYNDNTRRIPDHTDQFGSTDRYFSYFINASYVYAGKYIASFSARKDESNLFGVDANQKGVPLWSAGLAWNISKEPFYDINWLSYLKLRATYGYTGNVDKSISAYLTARPVNARQTYNTYFTRVDNPPNPSLRWEKVRNVNLGLDFGSRNSRLNGSIEFWRKRGLDLIGDSPVAPQAGIDLYRGNSASTRSEGLDVMLSSANIVGPFSWSTTALLNFSRDKVVDYMVSNGTNYQVIAANYNNPLTGYPYYALFSFPYKGLDANGDPLGVLNGETSTNYADIINSDHRDNLVYHGSSIPTLFGGLRNTFTWNGFDLSFNITYKLGYYFNRRSLNNISLYSGKPSYLQADYENRWMEPGDELVTDVPALVYPANYYRSYLYNNSEALVEKGDHIRLQDIRFGYTIENKPYLPVRRLKLFIYIKNIGLLYRANDLNIDPDYPTGVPAVRTVAFGFNLDI